MAACRSCSTFRNANYKKGVSSKSGSWSIHCETQTELKHEFVTQATTVLLPKKLINRQRANFPKSSVNLEIQGARMVTYK